MKVVKNGNKFIVYGDDLIVRGCIPCGTYCVRFTKDSGYYLEKRADMSVSEALYGSHEQKANKVFKRFKSFDRNLGVILSGDKGIGKSLFARFLASKMLDAGYPVIVVDTYYQNMQAFISSIQQECVIMLDEFEKVFKESDDDTRTGAQEEMLSLFDGTGVGKKLFVLTCNDLWRLNNCLINRPGRFHYHIRFNYPNEGEIRQYLTDKIGESKEIENVVNFSRKVKLNYDCLKAIACEISDGETFESAIEDLNIVNSDLESFDIVIRLDNGIEIKQQTDSIAPFGDEENYVRFYINEKGIESYLNLHIIPNNGVYSKSAGGFVHSSGRFRFEWADEDSPNVESVVVKQKGYDMMRYVLPRL